MFGAGKRVVRLFERGVLLGNSEIVANGESVMQIVIYGAGYYGESILDTVKKYPEIEIVGFDAYCS